MKKMIYAGDIDDIIITQVVSTEEDYTKDIIITFPEKYGIKPISFMDIGLINAKPDIIGYTNAKHEINQVLITFYGKHQYKFE